MNYSSSHTQIHLSGPVTTDNTFYDTATSATHQPYGTVNIRAGQAGVTFFLLDSAQAQAIAAAFGAMAADLAIEEVEQGNLKAEREAAEQAAADAREQQAPSLAGALLDSLKPAQ